MRRVSRLVRVALGVSLAAVLLSSAQAGVIEMIEPGQKPPKEEPAAQTPPEPDKCVVDEGGFRSGQSPSFTIALRNHCEMRFRCTVNAYVVTSQGPTKGQGTLVLEPKSNGAGSYKEWSLKLKEGSGMANASRKCVDL